MNKEMLERLASEYSKEEFLLELIKERKEAFKAGYNAALSLPENERLPTNQVKINGLLWDTENLVIDGKTHFTYEEALREAKSAGKRLPTKKEFEELLKLGYRFSKSDKGLYVADNKLFFPAAGFRDDSDGSLAGSGSYGYVWSSTPNGASNAYYLYFYASDAYVSIYDRTYGFSVRCVQNVK